MEKQKLTASEILDQAAILLEEEDGWARNAYIEYTSKGCAMCAHGAIAYCGNPEVKRLVLDRSLSAATAASAFACGTKVSENDLREEIRNHPLHLAHFTAAQVGLTFNYNDDPNTTQADVVRKLRSAAQIVRNNYGA